MLIACLSGVSAHAQNSGNVLPLSAAKIQSLALIGPCWEVSKGGYSQGGSGGTRTISTLAAVTSYLSSCDFARLVLSPSLSVRDYSLYA